MTVDATQASSQPGLQMPDPRRMQQSLQAAGQKAGVNFSQLGMLQQLLAQLLMHLMSFVDQNNAGHGGLNTMFAGIMGMNGDQYRDWRNDVAAHGGEWKSRTDFSGTDFNRARTVIMDPPKNLLDMISAAEHSRGNHESGTAYNTAYGNRSVNFTGMSVDQVIAWQRNDPGNSAAGRYQIVEGTLRGLKKEMGLTGDEKFTPEMQDRMAGVLLERRGLSRFLSGDPSMPEERFMRNLSQEWASLPKDLHGDSYYEGDRHGNHARIAPEAVLSVIRHERQQAMAANLHRETGSAASKYDPDGDLKVSNKPVSLAFAAPAAGVLPGADMDPQRIAPSPGMAPAPAAAL